MGATAPDDPVLEKTWECDDSEQVSYPTPASSSKKGLGDRVENMLASIGVTRIVTLRLKRSSDCLQRAIAKGVRNGSIASESTLELIPDRK